MTTASINDITVDLVNLYNAYNAVLGQAKTQLEAMEISDQHIDRIASSLLNRGYLINLIADQIISKLDHQCIDDLLDSNRFIGRVADRIYAKINSDVQREIRNYTSSDDFTHHLNHIIARCALADESLDSPVNILLRRRLRNALKFAFSVEAVDEAFNELRSSELA